MRLRNALAGTRCLNCPSVFDPMSARLAEAAGFGIGILGGSTAALTLLGLPDLNLITLTELCGLTRRIADASDIALIVDADGGYGNALNVMRTVGDLEAAGAAGLSIEDSWLPQAYGRHTDPLIPIDEAADKLRAAVAARRDPSFVLFARTSARACRSDHELIERLTRYADTGVEFQVVADHGDAVHDLGAVAVFLVVRNRVVQSGQHDGRKQFPRASALVVRPGQIVVMIAHEASFVFALVFWA